jgi:hypothetical protein
MEQRIAYTEEEEEEDGYINASSLCCYDPCEGNNGSQCRHRIRYYAVV